MTLMLPTTKDGMNAAIGQFIHGVVAEKIRVQEEKEAVRVAQPGFVPEPFVWDKKYEKEKKTDAQALADFCAMVRARKQ